MIFDAWGDDIQYGSTRSQTQFRTPPSSPGQEKDSSSKLHTLLHNLQTPGGLKLFQDAYTSNMSHKVTMYKKLKAEAERDVVRNEKIMAIQISQLKKVAKVQDDNDNWNIFESVSSQYREAKERSASFESIQKKAEAKIAEGKPSPQMRDRLLSALGKLLNYSTSQAHVVDTVVDVVDTFLKNPVLLRIKLMNFMLLGGAGTGKSTIAKVIGELFASAGMFVSGNVVEAGRAEVVGQYEGQTVARTRNFLISNLDNGVIFFDEAYGITPWDNGKVEGYGSEAATAIVEFTTRYVGLYCIIVAGYEKQMDRYFLGSNEGMARRFPYQLVLENMSPQQLVRVFQRKLLEYQGLPSPHGEDVVLESESYFDEHAWEYLLRIIQESTDGYVALEEETDPRTRKTYKNSPRFVPDKDLLYALFENQAGAMANLADEAVTVLMTQISFGDVVRKGDKATIASLIRDQPIEVMKTILRRRIRTMMRSHYGRTIEMLEEMEEELGF